MIAHAAPQYSFSKKETLVAISGSGNVAQFAALKVIELGATVVSLSDSKGALIANAKIGFTAEDVKRIGQLKLKGGSLEGFCGDGDYTYHAGEYFLRSFKLTIAKLYISAR
jgi:glutamate dehydrogenase (NADP+)